MLEAVYKKTFAILGARDFSCAVPAFCHFITQVIIVTGEPTLYLIIRLTRSKFKCLVA